MNLLALAQRLGESEDRTIVLNQAGCLHTIDKFSTCEACFEICPAGAIQPGKPPALDAEACQYCLACLPACPVGAYMGKDEVQTLANCAARLGTDRFEVVCALNPNLEVGVAEAAVRVRGCLAGLGIGAYLTLVSQGMEQVIVRTEACGECPWGALQPQVEAQVAGAQRLLAGMGKAEAIVCAAPQTMETLQKRPIWNADSPPMRRRDLFRWQAHDAETETAAAATSDLQNPFRERLRILRALQQLPLSPENAVTISMAGLGFGLLTISDKCTACGTCARACPTEALQFEITDDTFRLEFFPQACVGCDRCAHVCSPEAIAIDHAPTYDQLFGTGIPHLLLQGEVARCSKCNAPFAPQAGEKLCPICDFRRKNPFASVKPPGFSGEWKS